MKCEETKDSLVVAVALVAALSAFATVIALVAILLAEAVFGFSLITC